MVEIPAKTLPWPLVFLLLSLCCLVPLVAQDEMVEAQMKIDTKVKIDDDMRVRIKMAGLTGMKYLEIDRKEPDKPDLTPEITFRRTLRVIPSNPSEVQEILLGIENVFAKLKQLDMQRLEHKIHTSLDSLQVILSDKRLEATMANLEDTTASWRSASKRIDDMLQGPGVKETLVHAAATLKSLKKISADLSLTIEELNLSDRLKTSTNKFDFLMDDARLTSEEIRMLLTQQEDNVALILENLRTAAESLNNLAASLRDNPAQLLFAQPPIQKR